MSSNSNDNPLTSVPAEAVSLAVTFLTPNKTQFSSVTVTKDPNTGKDSGMELHTENSGAFIFLKDAEPECGKNTFVVNVPEQVMTKDELVAVARTLLAMTFK